MSARIKTVIDQLIKSGTAVTVNNVIKQSLFTAGGTLAGRDVKDIKEMIKAVKAGGNIEILVPLRDDQTEFNAASIKAAFALYDEEQKKQAKKAIFTAEDFSHIVRLGSPVSINNLTFRAKWN